MPGPSPNTTRNRLIASTVVIAGVVGVLAFDASRQRDQTAALSRQWIGEQWDVARNCLVGTPIGRGEDEATIAAALERQLVDTLAAASEADEEPDPEALWPQRCAAILPSLRADRSILRGDPGDALATLDVLTPRVIALGAAGPSQLAVSGARERARELAEPIARLDAVMPSGAEYNPQDHARPDRGMPAGVVLDSLACDPVAPLRRPFLSAHAGDAALYDELAAGDRSARLSAAPDGSFELAVVTPSGTTVTPLARPDARHPIFWDLDTLLWLSADAPRVTTRAIGSSEDGASTTLGSGAPFDRIALCRGDSRAHLVGARGERLVWIPWAGPGHDAGAPVSIRASVDVEAPLVTCDDETLVIAWVETGGWRGVVCAADRCEAMPPLAAGGDLQLAASDAVIAVGRGRRTDLPLARVLRREHGRLGWSDPVVVARGPLSREGGAFRIATCNGGAFRSTDGRRWAPEDAAPR